ncbi:gluconate 2-dehydrogenase subunit 3 family protein [Candidatus Pantoea multigeneris]|uniref:Gluconate 2-dehydrogenase subunit 3 family protein n=1 Tax=Candidatus Pantoea multigeneris TaxID=2608357 RepID=A0ABX0R7V4_9GAMM|nr:gluconate 2-dehydrogenase subunit 3 family protein [Pantoea multigeneris]NIF20351.1 gluconate 2-dehydrogenase subunit 3 family protein [Pantoea multigeneris]
MSNYGLTRRRFLSGTFVAIGALSVKYGTSNVFAAVSAPLQDLASYQPNFFTADEWKFILSLCDRLIPSDENGPGALETHVPVFLDKQLLTSYGLGHDWYMKGPFNSQASHLFGYQMPFNLQVLYRKGIELTNKFTHEKYSKSFAALSNQQRNDVISALEKGNVDFKQLGENDLNSSFFLTRVLENVKEGYLSDPQYGGNKDMAAWKMIGFPGARASFPQWIRMHNIKYPLGPVSVKGDQA